MITGSLIDWRLWEIFEQSSGNISDIFDRLFTSVVPGVVRLHIARDDNIVQLKDFQQILFVMLSNLTFFSVEDICAIAFSNTSYGISHLPTCPQRPAGCLTKQKNAIVLECERS